MFQYLLVYSIMGGYLPDVSSIFLYYLIYLCKFQTFVLFCIIFKFNTLHIYRNFKFSDYFLLLSFTSLFCYNTFQEMSFPCLFFIGNLRQSNIFNRAAGGRAFI